MRIVESSDAGTVASLLDRAPRRDVALERRVARIVTTVRHGGDRALLTYARRFDRLTQPIDVPPEEMRDAATAVTPDVREAIRVAAGHIAGVARRQLPRGWTTRPAPGITIEQRVTPLDRVGCYVPGGRYPLPSSLLMTAIPARVAGAREIIAACPRPDATVCAAALEAGVTRLLRIGGAHAIAALAYGTETIPKVDKIVGPGNAYVAAAKAFVAADCAIDFFAGPSEILVLSTTGRPAWIAADLLAQAEHDEHARAVFVTPDRRLARQVADEIARRMPEDGPAAAALQRNGAIVVTRSLDEAVALSERMAPEHAVCDTPAVARRLRRAGTIFVGDYSAQAAGDYATGSNHVLPTSGAAAARGGLSAADFVRVSTIQQLTRAGLKRIAPTAVALAEAEGLHGHAASIRLRQTDAPSAPRTRDARGRA
ncbi:MAG TPA: histidinol dehydrogenase [Vicinamibacterales bacterium]|nr:histidinol dehydrogenase [Vicinamibacterales bacterium]